MLFYALCFPDQTATVPLGECLTPDACVGCRFEDWRVEELIIE